MPTRRRKKVPLPPRNAWDTMLDRVDHEEPTQAGEVEPKLENSPGDPDRALDAETGTGGYAGEAVEEGEQEAFEQPERPVDAEIHGDPRTHAGSSYPDDVKVAEEGQKPIGESDLDREGP